MCATIKAYIHSHACNACVRSFSYTQNAHNFSFQWTLCNVLLVSARNRYTHKTQFIVYIYYLIARERRGRARAATDRMKRKKTILQSLVNVGKLRERIANNYKGMHLFFPFSNYLIGIELYTLIFTFSQYI